MLLQIFCFMQIHRKRTHFQCICIYLHFFSWLNNNLHWHFSFLLVSNYGRNPIPPSSVNVSPLIYLKSGDASCTHTRPISFSVSPKCPAGGIFTFSLKASGYAFSKFSSCAVHASGQIIFTLIPSAPHSLAATLDKPRIPSFAAAYAH